MIKFTRILPTIAIMIGTLTVQPITLFNAPFLSEVAQALQFKASTTLPSKAADPSKVINDLKNYQSVKIQIGSDIFLVDRSDMTHFLERHHPLYWDGSIKKDQTFYDKSMTVSDIEQAIKSVMSACRTQVTAIGPNGYAQLPDTTVGGVVYVLGLNKGHVGQFYPKVPPTP